MGITEMNEMEKHTHKWTVRDFQDVETGQDRLSQTFWECNVCNVWRVCNKVKNV